MIFIFIGLMILMIVWAIGADFYDTSRNGGFGNHNTNTVNNFYDEDTDVNNSYDGNYEVNDY